MTNILYVLLGIATNCIWGLALLVPYYLRHFDPALIVLSRYFFYGVISLILLSVNSSHWRSLTRLDWQKAMLFAFAGNLGYYLALSAAIHYMGIALSALIVGALPVTMMIYANFKNKEFSFKRLILPIMLMLIGIISLKYFQYTVTPSDKNIVQLTKGISWAVLALVIWTWYGVANAHYLKKNFTISGYSWSLAIGVCCFIQVLIIFPVLFFFNKENMITDLQQQHALLQLISGGIVLGVFVSWLATSWWNKISRHLPTTLAAQLLVFETISSLIYGYIMDHTYPQPMIAVSIIIVLLGIIAGIRVTISSKH